MCILLNELTQHILRINLKQDLVSLTIHAASPGTTLLCPRGGLGGLPRKYTKIRLCRSNTWPSSCWPATSNNTLSARVLYQSASTAPCCIRLVLPLTRSIKHCHAAAMYISSSTTESELNAHVIVSRNNRKRLPWLGSRTQLIFSITWKLPARFTEGKKREQNKKLGPKGVDIDSSWGQLQITHESSRYNSAVRVALL